MDKEEIKSEFIFEAEILLRQHDSDNSQKTVETLQAELTDILQSILLKNEIDTSEMIDLIAFIQPTILEYLDKLTE
ncbi:MAG: hypothetical protein JKY53_14185 [Flavobacteriales bacterium]|nr:hypothetical protein [Flavobacteriales bacterium]